MPLSPDGRVEGMWKKLNLKDQLNDIHHCDFPSYKWRRIAENIEAWEFHSSKKQKWMHSGRLDYFFSFIDLELILAILLFMCF